MSYGETHREPSTPRVHGILTGPDWLAGREESARDSSSFSALEYHGFMHDFTADSRCRSVTLHNGPDASRSEQTYSVRLEMHLLL